MRGDAQEIVSSLSAMLPVSVDDLEDEIYDYLLQYNAKPKPFVWSKTAEDIITRERRALGAFDEIRGNR